MMNLRIVTLVGNCLGHFRELEMDETDCSWGSTLRVWVSLDVNLLLKRSLKIQSTSGDELLVHFSYERLPNLCYICGHLGHIAKYCELQFGNDFIDPRENPPYRPWLHTVVLMRA
ncbi:UNVERIFIED_CONTAM: hypothetical protein Scaly_1801400 [Sesamum calycinum]|uniref:CCHC-type domain-containing protein n=1 Tax=Sesamum calycinum TaxID=2727403 RepID=A0AAW2NVK4_9LAMI